MTLNVVRLRKLHRILAPICCFPLVLTLMTGVGFQVMALDGQGDRYLWLLDAHRGKFGQINLEWVYPFLNAFGLLTLLITGILMWLRLPKSSPAK